MEQWADTLVEAIDAALARYSAIAWLDLSFRERAEAIEREVVRLEAEAVMQDTRGSQAPAREQRSVSEQSESRR